VVAFSCFHETAAVGDQAGSRFLNAAAELETDLAPLELLDRLQAIELELGRARETRWGPRTLDLDLVFYGSQIIESPRLVVPHPAAWYRRFVLDPLTEIAPRFVHPVKLIEVAALRDRLLARPLRVSLAGGTSAFKTELMGLLAPSFAAVEFSDWDLSAPGSGQGNLEPALILWLGRTAGAAPSAVRNFEDLPVLPRMDVTAGAEPIHDFARYVIQSALG
jgi:2-amino-4-hydroxy-6-hydroxymethyldihydropteridine diphosphokinase